MKFYKIDLLTLLIGLFLFASCKSSNTIGLEVDPETAVAGELIDSVTIRTQTLRDDPTTTNGIARYPLGLLNDPVLGTTESSLAMSVNLPESAFKIPLDAALDSAVLVLPYASEFYGDSTSIYSVDVHQLTDNLSAQTAFMSNKEWAYETSSELVPNGLVGNFTGRIKPNTPVKYTEVVVGKPDSTLSVKALRIRLDNRFITERILKIPVNALTNSAFFNARFKGLHLSVNKSNANGKGAMAYFNLANGANAQLELYYKHANATTATKIDTVSAKFPINTSLNPVAATIKHNYTGTPVETQLANPEVQYQTTYLQGTTGLRNKISFPHLANLIQNLGGKVIINKAELVVNIEAGSDVAPFVPANRLALYRYDIGGQRVHIPDVDVLINPETRVIPSYLGLYNATNKNYTFIVTRYMQDLLDGKTVDYGTFISPSADYDLFGLPASSGRSVIGAFSNPTNKVKLNIYYTRIK
jgi:hypothetical protein